MTIVVLVSFDASHGTVSVLAVLGVVERRLLAVDKGHSVDVIVVSSVASSPHNEVFLSSLQEGSRWLGTLTRNVDIGHIIAQLDLAMVGSGLTIVLTDGRQHRVLVDGLQIWVVDFVVASEVGFCIHFVKQQRLLSAIGGGHHSFLGDRLAIAVLSALNVILPIVSHSVLVVAHLVLGLRPYSVFLGAGRNL
jgi:hypothetical protein